jgi:hypothetical protein
MTTMGVLTLISGVLQLVFCLQMALFLRYAISLILVSFFSPKLLLCLPFWKKRSV